MIVSLAEMKTYLGVTGTDDDQFLEDQIGLVSDAIEAYCRRKFEATAYVQTFYSEDYKNRSDSLYTHMYPIIAINSIAQDARALTGYRVHRESGKILYREGFYHGAELQIEYVAGFTAINMPKAIISVVRSLVEERFNKKKAGIDLSFGSDVQRVSIPGTISVDFDYTLQNNERSSGFGVIIGTYSNVLDYYRSDRAILGPNRIAFVEEV